MACQQASTPAERVARDSEAGWREGRDFSLLLFLIKFYNRPQGHPSNRTPEESAQDVPESLG